jgi:4-carboxymuconolactone decarboxylase
MADADATPVLDVVTNMTAASLEATKLDPATLVQLRLAALVALDAPPASYLFHLAVGAETGLTLEDTQQVLMALAPLVGSARIVSAAGNIARALGLAIALHDEEGM